MFTLDLPLCLGQLDDKEESAISVSGGWLKWAKERRSSCSKNHQLGCTVWLTVPEAFSSPRKPLRKVQAVHGVHFKTNGKCRDVEDTLLMDDNYTRKLTCLDLTPDCTDGDDAEAVSALCPVTCGACDRPCRDVLKTTYEQEGRPMKCPELKHLCLSKKPEMRAHVQALCPVTCGICKFSVPFEISNSTRTIRHAINSGRYDDVSLQVPARSVAEPWRIPRILHQTWKTDRMPAKFIDVLASWRRLHPHWRFEFWDDRRNLELVREHFPQYADAFDRMSGIKKADVARIAALYAYGGVYADIDVEAARSFEPLLSSAAEARAGVLLGEENYVHTILLEKKFSGQLVSNAVMVGSVGHPFWLKILEEIFENKNCGDDPVACTGPRLVDRLSLEERGCGKFGCVVRLPYQFFYPQIAHWNSDAVRHGCVWMNQLSHDTRSDKMLRSTNKACRWFEDVSEYPSALQSRDTFAIHKWQCSWCREDSTLKKTLPLSDIVYRVGNETLFQLCNELHSSDNSLSTLLLDSIQERNEARRNRPVLAHSYVFENWFEDAFPKACGDMVTTTLRKAKSKLNEGAPINDVRPCQPPRTNASIGGRAVTSSKPKLRSKSEKRVSASASAREVGRWVAMSAAGVSFAVASARMVMDMVVRPKKNALPK